MAQGTTINQLQQKYQLIFNTLVLDIEGAELDLIKFINFDDYSFRKIIIEFHDFANILTNDEVIFCREKLIASGFVFEEKLAHSEVWLKN